MKPRLLFFFLTIITACCVNENKTNTSNTDTLSENTKTADFEEMPVEVRVQQNSVIYPSSHEKVITVGGSNADVQGYSSEAIQIAVDAVHDAGKGGTIMLFPGKYEITAPVRLYDNMSLIGSGPGTVLKKYPGFRSAFALDADYGELQITVKDASGFKPGMGVVIYDDEQRSAWDVTTARISSVKGNVLYIDEYLLRDYHTEKNGTVSNSCSVISAIDAKNLRIANLTVDGTGESNDMIDGCRAGGIYLHKVQKALIENVTVKNFNCDGISWQLTEYVTVRNCEVYGCANSGLHPGTGSPFTVIEGNNSYNNGGYGLFVCWRVRNGTVKNNRFHNNGINGISTGHKDTDMLFSYNHIYENGSDGIQLRGETNLNAPHRSIFRNNLIENNGIQNKGFGIVINCAAEGVIIEDNIMRNTGKGTQIAAVLLTKNSIVPEMKNNRIDGMPNGEIVKENN